MPLLDPGDGLTFRFPAIRLGMTLWRAPVSIVIPRFNLNFLLLIVLMEPVLIFFSFSALIARMGTSMICGKSVGSVAGGQTGS